MDLPRTTIWIFVLIQCCLGVVQDKVWRRSTSWKDPANWQLGRPPCPSERALLGGLTVGLPRGSTVVREVILSFNGGDLVFPPTAAAELVVTGLANDSTCPPKDAVFERKKIQPWMDPGNWGLRGADFSAAVPHTERIPCLGDRVVFPQDNTFYVRLPNSPTSVAAVNLDGQDLSSSEWVSWLRSARGRAQMVDWRGETVRVAPDDCGDVLCRCHRDAAHVEQEVCAFATPGCRPAPCLQPIQPPGHCCPLCGSWIMVGHGGPSSQPILDVLERTLPPGVEMHASLSDGGDVYVVMVDGRDGGFDGLSVDAAHAMADALRKDSQLQVHSLSLVTSGPALKMSLASSFFSGVFGTLSLVVVVLGTLYVLVYSRYSFPSLKVESAPFVRFENVALEAEEEDAAVKVVTPPPQPPPQPPPPGGTQAFHNPMYGQPGLENPTYQQLQHRQELEEVDIESSST